MGVIFEARVKDFVRVLAAQHCEPGVFNPWSNYSVDAEVGDKSVNNIELRKELLTKHLMRDARYVLIGEAPGYQGCRFSGIPFTSERLLLEGKIPDCGVNARITWRDPPWSEPSATIVWGALHSLLIASKVVLWNTFPFHPWKGSGLTNRQPTKEEFLLGYPFIKKLVALYPGAVFVAVGRNAERWLDEWEVFAQAVRHPANGGATKFREGLKAITVLRDTLSATLPQVEQRREDMQDG